MMNTKYYLMKIKKQKTKGLTPEPIGIQVPDTKNVDETTIYDLNLINGLKTKFKEWKSGWKEQHLSVQEMSLMKKTYIEGHEPFFTDIKKSIKTKIVILLDHSSSIASDAARIQKSNIGIV